MNRFAKIFFTCLILTSTTLSQEITDSLGVDDQAIQLNKSLSSVLDDLDFYLNLHDLNKMLLINTDPNTTWLWTSYAISNSQEKSFQSEINFNDMTLPLYQKYLEDSKFNPFRYALGMVQAGAVGYLAYTHIKKYGFLKK
jgi:hypothetical protein